MSRIFARLAVLVAAPLCLGGCVVGTAVDVVTAPVRAVGQVVDWTTTSQEEADRNRGREIRKLEAYYGKLAERYEEERDDCLDGDKDACDKASRTWAEMDTVRAQIPAPPVQEPSAEN